MLFDDSLALPTRIEVLNFDLALPTALPPGMAPATAHCSPTGMVFALDLAPATAPANVLKAPRSCPCSCPCPCPSRRCPSQLCPAEAALAKNTTYNMDSQMLNCFAQLGRAFYDRSTPKHSSRHDPSQGLLRKANKNGSTAV